MDNITTALAPVFAAGFAVQQLLEIPGTIIDLSKNENAQKFKKIILGIIGVIIGCTLAGSVDDLAVLRVLLTHMDAAGKPVVPEISRYVEVPVSGLIISAGTEGLNSILKFMKYTKEDKKNAAANSDPTKPADGAAKPDALEDINLK